MTERLHDDQRVVLLALLRPWEFWAHDDNSGIRGVTVDQIVKKTGKSIEKVLLSLGWLEERERVAHDMGIQRTVIDYFGHSNVTIPGSQTSVRMFYLTTEGIAFAKSLEEEE